MANATVVLSESNGLLASIVVTDDISNINFGSGDITGLTPASYPIVAQEDGHSYEKWLRLKVESMGDSSILDNFKVWASDIGSGWVVDEGISCNLVTTAYTEASYPTGGPVETDSIVAVNAIPESQPPNPNVGVGGSLTGQITAIGYTDYFVLQLDVGDSTPSGSVNQKVISLQWDEQ